MAKQKTLSDALLGTLKVTRGRLRIRDTRIPGLVLEASSSHKRFVVRYRGHYKTLGRWPIVSTQEAKALALEYLRGIELGAAPAKGGPSTPSLPSPVQARGTGPTLAETLGEYVSTKRLKERTGIDYRLCLERYWADHLEKPLADLTGDAVLARFRSIQSPAQANYSLRIIRALFRFHNAAHDDSLTIPTAKVLALHGAHRIAPRSRLIPDNKQMAWYLAVLSRTGPHARDLFIFLACTGLRLGEALGLRWSDIDMGGRSLIVQETKNGKPHTLPLGHRMVALLEGRRGLAEDESSRVFPINERNVRKAVARTIEACSAEWSSHDLRRGLVSLAVRLGIPDRLIKRIVNHSERDVTGKHYAHFGLDAIRPHMQTIEDALWAMWEGKQQSATGPP